MFQKSFNTIEKQQENVFYPNVVPFNLLVFSYCLPCLQAVNVGTPVDPGAAQSGSEQPTCWGEHWATQGSRAELLKHQSGCSSYNTAEPPQRLVFLLTPKQEAEGGVVGIS